MRRTFNAAIADYTEAVRITPSLSEAYLYRGYLHTFARNYSAASADFNRVLQRDPNSAEAQFGQSFIRTFQQHNLNGGSGISEVLPWLNDTIRRQPDFAAAYLVRGVAQAKLGNLEQSRQDLEQAIALQQAQQTQLSAANTPSANF